MEALLAFFLESTFLGLWIFGWDVLPARLHNACSYAVAAGTCLSAYFILAANSWMQHPVGYTINHRTDRAELTSIFQVLTNPWLFYAFGHTIAAAFVTAGMVVLGVSAWHLRRGHEVEVFRPAIRLAIPVVFVAAMITMFVGHTQAQYMTTVQPMKMAAAEALYHTESGASFSLFAVAPFEHNPGRSTFDISIPHGLSILATNTWDGKVQGIDDLNRMYQQKYGPGDYTPIIGVTYWSFRIMSGIGFVVFLLSAYGLYLLWRSRLERSHRYMRVMTWAIALPFIANSFGWIFTEMGRQPWVVQGLLLTVKSASPNVSAWMVGTTLGGFVLLYAMLAAVDGWLMARYAKFVPPLEPEPDPHLPSSAALAMPY
jgi:cytochrome d ubiquinol oxidase subunit I